MDGNIPNIGDVVSFEMFTIGRSEIVSGAVVSYRASLKNGNVVGVNVDLLDQGWGTVAVPLGKITNDEIKEA